jgi:hypothetical protein
MDTKSMAIVTAHLIRLAAIHGWTLTTEKIDAYQEDLTEFTEQEAIAAITWARRNLTRFPMIADLRLYIEGSDEDHANKAWDAMALMRSAYSADAASFTLCDVVMAKTIRQTWGSIHGMCYAYMRPMDQFGRDAMKKAFKVAYLNNYKQRDLLRREMGYPAVFGLEPNPQPRNDDYVFVDYMVDSSYSLVEISRRTIKALPRGQGMTPEQRQHLEAMLNNIGRDHGRSKRMTSDTPKPLEIIPTPFLRNATGDIDVERVRKYTQRIRDNAAHVPTNGHTGDAADRGAVALPGAASGQERTRPPEWTCRVLHPEILAQYACDCDNTTGCEQPAIDVDTQD